MKMGGSGVLKEQQIGVMDREQKGALNSGTISGVSAVCTVFNP